jgi:hypothetical protein
VPICNADAFATRTWSFTPSKDAAGFASLVSSEPWLSSVPLTYVPGFLAATSAAVVPDVSPSRQ